MKDYTKQLMAILTGSLAITLLYFKAGIYLHELANSAPVIQHNNDNLDLLVAGGIALLLIKPAQYLAIPISRGFAKMYNTNLE